MGMGAPEFHPPDALAHSLLHQCSHQLWKGEDSHQALYGDAVAKHMLICPIGRCEPVQLATAYWCVKISGDVGADPHSPIVVVGALPTKNSSGIWSAISGTRRVWARQAEDIPCRSSV